MQPGEKIAESIENEFKEYGVEPINFDIKEKINLADRLLDAIDKKQNPCVVGLDPTIEKIPKHLINGDSFADIAEGIKKFNYGIIDAIADLVPAVKPQIAFYERYGSEGIKAFKDTVDYAKSKGLIVIEDGKRNDIGSTSKAYADAHLGKVKTTTSSVPSINVDLLTVNPYLGSDGLKPFVEVSREFGKGIFILVKTSNPSSGELQDRLIEITSEEKNELKNLGIELDENKTEMFNLVGLQVNSLAQQLKGNRGYSSIGAVIGATYPQQAETLRKIMPNSIFLVPGYGAQGGGADDVIPCFNKDGYGAVVNSSRGIIFAYEKDEGYSPEEFAQASRRATQLMIKDICSALERAGKSPINWKAR
ncbi:orotidine-5'-phosphate decarboxylase [Candidatus Pacearchaeota archaeon]|nr:orotidine-5'-phosphate decarboxylase [Candidatus Pacearchaeota archaeon]